MADSFVKPWTRLLAPGAASVSVPTLQLAFTTRDGRWIVERFLVDSGADVSMSSRDFCEELGLNWEAGEPIQLKGISPRPECSVAARVFQVELMVPDIGVSLLAPICFADGDASHLLGREGFFDVFRVTFDKRQQTTRFELIEE